MRPGLVLGVVLVWGVGLVAGPMADAQPARALTVDEWVTLALRSNPELRAARAELEAAAARVRQAALRPNPMLDLGGQKAISPDNNLSVGLTLPLDLNGRKQGRVGVAEREVEVRHAQLADRQRRLRADVQMKVGEALAARRALEVTDELLGVSRNALILVAERVRQGAAPALDENLMRVEVNRLEAGRLIQASRVEIASLQLKALAGAMPDEPLDVQGDLASPPPRTPEPADVLSRAVELRPDVRAARAEAAMAQARVRKEQAEGRWDASVNVGYQRQDMGFNLRGLTDTGATRQIQDVFHYFGAGVSVILPVRNGNEGNVAAAGAEATAAERRREFSELVVRQEVTAALAQSDAARRTVELYERGVRGVARANVEVLRQSYGLGRATLLDVIAEQRRYIEVENGYTDVLRHAWDAAVELERAVGGAVP
jgi:cobalt-zinc-cadmium efflux system outer membrane protein